MADKATEEPRVVRGGRSTKPRILRPAQNSQ
jgi:hypothetical protein